MNKLNYSNSILVMIFCSLMAGNAFSITTVNQNSKQFVVVIDPGHGGKDPGAVNKSVREKEVVLGIGLKLGKLISESYPEVKVIFTRNTDVFIPLIDRSRIANKSKADLFISIHANICATPSTRGTETFFLGQARTDDNLEVAQKENSVIVLEDDYTTTYEGYDPKSSESQIMFEYFQNDYLAQSLYLAEAIQQQFKSHSESPNRGVKQAGFLVLRMSSMPSVLVESGFISNPTEANYLSSEEGQQHIALSVYEAFKKFKNKTSGSVTPNNPVVIASHQKQQEALPKQVAQAENQKSEEKKKIAVVDSTINSVKAEPEKEKVQPATVKTEAEKVKTPSSADQKDIIKVSSTNYYSVQIGANTTPVDPVAANFKGFKNVRREKEDKYYRYYIGSENTSENLAALLKEAKLKFPQAFIVSFIDGKRIPLYEVTK